MEQKFCSLCRHDNPVKNFFCTQCGSKLLAVHPENPRLLLLNGEPPGATFLLKKGRNTIGRDGGNSIALADEQVSNKHAIISNEGNSYFIEDRQSKNGVHVNGKKIIKERLQDGSIIKLGLSVLQFEQARTKLDKVDSDR